MTVPLFNVEKNTQNLPHLFKANGELHSLLLPHIIHPPVQQGSNPSLPRLLIQPLDFLKLASILIQWEDL